ncbi:pol [Symbiodinium necroappetens]|uniref:Pol protein n=1 Tax=Symbiodinium necroappetens TaxID=1628268 RepID=A0A812U9K7_9DINO|nr:pol [Symbiodinium necroappetens]
MLKNMDNGQEPTANDQVTGKPKEELQQMWADFGPDVKKRPRGNPVHVVSWSWGDFRKGVPHTTLYYTLRLGTWYPHVLARTKAYASTLHQFTCHTNFVRGKRYHDEIAFCCDLNYDVLDIVNVDERGVPLGQLLRIDFILFALPSMTFWDDRVIEGSDTIVGSDHCAISVSLQSLPSIGREARDLAKQIADTRKKAKKEWLAALLEKSAGGGRSKAIADLRAFYQRKYTPQEIRDVAFMCKHNKSTGADGISYEALQPIVLSSTVAKVFTKALMLRLRPRLPDIGAFQAQGSREAEVLLDVICNSRVGVATA